MSAKVRLQLCTVVVVCTVLLLIVRQHAQHISVQEAQKTLAVPCGRLWSASGETPGREWVTVRGKVVRLLPDEQGRFRHQRFLLSCGSNRRILIVNDVSIGMRVPEKIGFWITAHGEYVWTPTGGLIHFTHHSDTGGQGGWILYRNKIYAWITVRTKKWTTAPLQVAIVDVCDTWAFGDAGRA